MAKLIKSTVAFYITLMSLSGFASNFISPKLTCITDTPVSFVNTCSPDVVLRVSMQDATNLDSLNLNNFLPLSLFENGAGKFVKIIHPSVPASTSVAYFGFAKSFIGLPAKKLMVEFSSWPNSSAVGISQMLSNGKVINGFEGNVFFNFSPENNVANSCTSDASSTLHFPVLRCPVVSTSTNPNLVISAVAPTEFLGIPSPKIGALGKIEKLLNTPTPLFMTGFGVAVNKNLYQALQRSNQSQGLIPSFCSIGDMANASCQPSLTSASIASLLSTQGSLRSANGLIQGDNTPLHVNIYNPASSTQAATGINFLNTPCGNFTKLTIKSPSNLDFVSSADNSLTFFTHLQDSEMSAADGLKRAQTGYAIGVLPLSIVPTAEDNWNFIRVDNQSPNFSPTGDKDPTNRVGMTSGNYGFITTSFAISPLKENALVKSLASALVSALQNISNTDLPGVAYLDGSNTDLLDKQSSLTRALPNNCAPLITATKSQPYQSRNNISYVGASEVVTTQYLNGNSYQTIKSPVGKPVVTWANDHVTKTITYTYADKTSNSVISTVPPKVVTSYVNDKQTIQSYFGDGYSTTQLYNASGSVVSWGSDHETQTTTYSFPNGGTNVVSIKYPGQPLSAPSYNGGTETVTMHFFDGSPDGVVSYQGKPKTSFSNDGGTKTVTYTFPDATTNTVTYVGTAKIDTTYTPTSATTVTTYNFPDGSVNIIMKIVSGGAATNGTYSDVP